MHVHKYTCNNNLILSRILRSNMLMWSTIPSVPRHPLLKTHSKLPYCTLCHTRLVFPGPFRAMPVLLLLTHSAVPSPAGQQAACAALGHPAAIFLGCSLHRPKQGLAHAAKFGESDYLCEEFINTDVSKLHTASIGQAKSMMVLAVHANTTCLCHYLLTSSKMNTLDTDRGTSAWLWVLLLIASSIMDATKPKLTWLRCGRNEHLIEPAHGQQQHSTVHSIKLVSPDARCPSEAI